MDSMYGTIDHLPEVMLKRHPNLLQILYRNYIEPHRFYHNKNHILRIFNIAEDNLNLHKLTPELYAQIWFHDFVYAIPRDKIYSNEALSAVYAQSYLYDNENFRLDVISQAIKDTENHIPTQDESKALIDLDLFDLSTERYYTNSILIKEEYLTHYTKEQFCNGRIAWLTNMLSRQNIYWGVYAGKKEDEMAKKNMERELKKMQAIKKRYYS